MQLRSYAHGFAIFASLALALPAIAPNSAYSAECQDLSWSKDQLSKFDSAAASEQVATKQTAASKTSEIDAAIASLEQDLSTRKGEAAAKGEAMLKDIRAGRDAYQVRRNQPAARVMSAATADAGRSTDETVSALWAKVDAYLDTVNADISTRQAATQTKFLGN